MILFTAKSAFDFFSWFDFLTESIKLATLNKSKFSQSQPSIRPITVRYSERFTNGRTVIEILTNDRGGVRSRNITLL